MLNAVGLTAVMIVKGYAFSSVWCLYAAIVSVVIYWRFSHSHIDIEDPNSSFGAWVECELASFRRSVPDRSA